MNFIRIVYGYELIFALVSYLGINRTENILKFIEKVKETGFGAIYKRCNTRLG